MKTEQIIRGAMAGLLSLGVLASASGPALAAKADVEKCAGIARAGKNDCGTAKSSCAGTAKVDNDAEAWVLVPKGTCEKIAGGTVTDKPYNAHGGLAAMKQQ
ncbi:DUF2282 domain-containing protein [Azotobacter chroococcum]|uniref:DUF2282 domain-containing protein n=1 Tax=Azotobacter chroococcum TaxID=353 RepID=A0AA44C6X6_9GAMM|nr:DUF2282 domain-containing protein [Azotobacter chroococcum]NHN76177.1 DUF2282 domain-containing protein [Azotobacter chroococcum]TBW07797.1 DUF2282 domain-containing protein [Azotobacter chroococcum subsp. isscasi]